MFLVVEPALDLALERLSPDARSAWLVAVMHCDRVESDIVPARELDGADESVVDQWVQAGLAARMPFGHVRLLARGRLWDIGARSPRAA
jgi:hypothetical protein